VWFERHTIREGRSPYRYFVHPTWGGVRGGGEKKRNSNFSRNQDHGPETVKAIGRPIAVQKEKMKYELRRTGSVRSGHGRPGFYNDRRLDFQVFLPVDRLVFYMGFFIWTIRVLRKGGHRNAGECRRGKSRGRALEERVGRRVCWGGGLLEGGRPTHRETKEL